MSELRLRSGRAVDLVARMWLGLAILIAVTSRGPLIQLDMSLFRVTIGPDKLGASFTGDAKFRGPQLIRGSDKRTPWELDPNGQQTVGIIYIQTSIVDICWRPGRPIIAVALSHWLHVLIAVTFNALLYWRRLELNRKPDSRPRSELQAELWGARETDSDQSPAPHADQDSESVEEFLAMLDEVTVDDA